MADIITVLFVDDEPAILRGLERQLLTIDICPDSTASPNRLYAAGASEALDIMAQTECDIIVTDMRMPGMDGAALLNAVRAKYPQTVRIILSGYSDGGFKLLTTGLAHQYLAKPCDLKVLQSVLQETFRLRSLLHNDGLKKIVAQMATLPSLPTLYQELMIEIQSPNSSLKQVGKIVAKDSGMTAKILQLVNSAYFGLPRQVTTASQAVTLLGLDTIKSLILSIHIFTKFKKTFLKSEFRLKELLTHNLTVAALARCIARQQGANQHIADMAFTAGILHDVGKLIMIANLSEQYQWALALAQKQHISLLGAEKHIFNTTHAIVGAYLLNLWGLPHPIVEAVAYHHTPADSVSRQFSPLTAVHVANAWAYQAETLPLQYSLSEIDPAYIGDLNLIDQLPVWQTACQNLLDEDIVE